MSLIRLENVMKIFIPSLRRKVVAMGLAATTSAVLMSAVYAQPAPQAAPRPADTEFGPYDGTYAGPEVQAAPSRLDRAQFDRSGTRGREGLGANPEHPEGSGDVSD